MNGILFVIETTPVQPIRVNRTLLIQRVNEFVVDASNLVFPLKVRDSVRKPDGKWPKDFGNAICFRINDF